MLLALLGGLPLVLAALLAAVFAAGVADPGADPGVDFAVGAMALTRYELRLDCATQIHLC